MIKTLKYTDWTALVSLVVFLLLAFWAEDKHAAFSTIASGGLFFYAAAIIVLGVFAGSMRRMFPMLLDWVFAIAVAVYLYRIWPHMFFDDAGFIMRYLDQLKDGHWFHYNGGEGAVFGISGFIHGLFCSVLVKLTGMSAERSLHISNLFGLTLSVYFLTGIFRRLIHRDSWAYISAFLVVCFSKNWGDVLFTGMETPLHVALVLGALYFFIEKRIAVFYFFAALAVVSKLDAVPVMAVLMVFHAVELFSEKIDKDIFLSEAKRQALFFWTPILLWIIAAVALFGSPFPQSAKAKVLYHSGAHHSFFPFLEGFINDVYKYPLLWLFVGFFVVHLFYIRRFGIAAITRYFAFGWMYIAIMAMYFFYNPNERMLWYYALPDLLLVAQCTLSVVWIASLSKDWKTGAFPPVGLFLLIIYVKPDVDGGRSWMFDYLEKVERERYEVGKYIAREGTEADTLLAWHGLIARPFPGFVIDGTGLNSKMAVEFRLNKDSMISVLRPKFGIHHAFSDITSVFSKNGYSIRGMFADITLENWPAWVWWQRNENGAKYVVEEMGDSLLRSGRITSRVNLLKLQGPSVRIAIPKNAKDGKLWGGFEGRSSVDREVTVKIWEGDSVIGEQKIKLPFYGHPEYPSLYTIGAPVLFSRSEENLPMFIEFLPAAGDTVVKINNPIFEYSPN